MNEKLSAIEEILAKRQKKIQIHKLENDEDNNHIHVVYEHEGIIKEVNINNFFSHHDLVKIISDIIFYQIDTDTYNINMNVLSDTVKGEDNIFLIKLLINNSLGNKNFICSISKLKEESKFEIIILVKEDDSHFHDYDLIFLDYTDMSIGELVSEVVSSVNQNWEVK